ncbi:hypothetical protein PtrM4_010270 [Pyrenophora tritici-repentis]|uniref:Uncharacterized protein n=1 Tax=Pyrenophora tritici-repentis TaxID=45151 RepID=A0A317AH81_9PLEO|nr:hypothetical protein PtrM4_010270 [Pyrenophora tritici-repentis]
MFCPFHLLTEDDLQSIHSSGSDRSSLSSGSPRTVAAPAPAAANSLFRALHRPEPIHTSQLPAKQLAD